MEMIKHSGILLSVSENPNQTKEGTKYHNEDPYAGSRIIYFNSLKVIHLSVGIWKL